MKRIMITALLGLTLGGCAVHPSQPLTADKRVPLHWQATQSEQTIVIDSAWWQRFNSPELIRLLALANQHNQDWQAAQQRIIQARAALQLAAAPLWPTITAGASAAADRQQATTSHQQSASVQVGFEVDLFGRTSAARQAAHAAMRASEYAAAGVRLVLETDIAATYFQLCLLAEQLALQEKQYRLASTLLDRILIKRTLGAATAVDVINQQQLLATLAADLQTLKATHAATHSALAILIGTVPQELTVKIVPLTDIQPAIPAAMQPSILLTRRPDVLQAEANLLAAEANVAAARAAFFPNITLSASAVLSDLALAHSNLVSKWAAALTAPLFTGGKLTAGLTGAQAKRAELSATYRQTVLQALKEAEDALQRVNAEQQRGKQLQQAFNAAQQAYQLTIIQYEVGDIDYVALLDAERTLLTSERDSLQSQYQRLNAMLTLYKALGGAPTC